MIEVFRVEHVDTHQGPFYNCDAFSMTLAMMANQVRYLPSPSDDGMALFNRRWVFGAPSLNRLKSWFLLGDTVEANIQLVDELSQHGYVLAEYLVSEGRYRLGARKNQVVFDADDCRSQGLVHYHDVRILTEQSPLVFDTQLHALEHVELDSDTESLLTRSRIRSRIAA